MAEILSPFLTHCHGHLERVHTEITDCKSTKLSYVFGNKTYLKKDVQNLEFFLLKRGPLKLSISEWFYDDTQALMSSKRNALYRFKLPSVPSPCIRPKCGELRHTNDYN